MGKVFDFWMLWFGFCLAVISFFFSFLFWLYFFVQSVTLISWDPFALAKH